MEAVIEDVPLGPPSVDELLYKVGRMAEELGLLPGELIGPDIPEFDAVLKQRMAERMQPERSAIDDILMVPITITLAGKEYEVHPHKIADENKWRKALGKIAGIVAGALGPVFAGAATGKGIDLKDIDMAGLLRRTVPRIIVDGIPAATDLMLAYCPAMADDWEVIKAGSTPLERMEAALDVVQFAFPTLLALLNKMMKLAGAARQ